MRRAISQPRAVVADGRPLERGLVRFLLDEAGYIVVAEAGTAHDTAEAVREYRPDVLVLNENTAVDHGVPVIADLRRASPATKFILVTSSGATASADLLDEADAVIEEGAGIKELGFALESTRRGIRTEKPLVHATLRHPSSSEPGVREHLRWLERMQGAAAASMLIIAIALFAGPYGGMPSGPDGNREASVHLSAAYRSLAELAERASTADPSEVGSLVLTLLTQRELVRDSGGDVTALDQEIVTTLRPLVRSMSPEAATTLLTILRALVPGSEFPAPPVESTDTPEPSPRPDENATQSPLPESPVPSETPPLGPDAEPSHAPPPRRSPSPEPDPTEPSPSPTEPSPSPTEPSPSPTEPSPSPTEPSPSPTEPSPTADVAPINPGLIVVPPGIGVLVAVSRSARRRRSQRGPISFVHLESASSRTSESDDLTALNDHSSASQKNADGAEELVRRLTTVRVAIEEQTIRVSELEEQFKSELRRVQMLRAPNENPSGAVIHDDRKPPQGVS